MKLWIEVFATIGKNIGALLFSWIKSAWVFLRLGPIFRAVFWILGKPYDWFRKLSRDGKVEFSKYAAPQHKAFVAILDLLFVPYNCYLDSTDGIGESDMDKQALRFWFTVGWVSIPLVILVLFYFMNYHKSAG